MRSLHRASIRMRATGAVATAAALALTCAACGTSSGSGAAAQSAATGPGSISVVASTNVYGDIVSSIAGPEVRVTSIISDPNQDPHSYEANAKTQSEIAKAALIIENGGGYDDFVDSMISSAKSSAPVINAVDISGKKATAGDSLNEHVWYDFPTMLAVIQQIATQLTKLVPSSGAAFAANAATLSGQIQSLQSQEAAIAAAYSGTGAAITEPVPLYLLTACGLVNKTPAGFSDSVEQGTDVSVRDLQDTLSLFSSRSVALLVYNEQTSGPETERVIAAAKSAKIPTVPVTETLPSGDHYVEWMSSNLAAIKTALSA